MPAKRHHKSHHNITKKKTQKLISDPYLLEAFWVIASTVLLIAIVVLTSPEKHTQSLPVICAQRVCHQDESRPKPKPAPKRPIASIHSRGALQQATLIKTFSQALTTKCDKATIVNIVAHEDDDLLFMNPDTFKSLDEGDCVRTIYLTSGDDGMGQGYSLERQRAAEAGYATMLGSSNEWIEQTVTLRADAVLKTAQMKDLPNITLIFFNLPDGNLDGSGFYSSHYQSLAKLNDGVLPSIDSVDGRSSYSAGQLTMTLYALLGVYQPTQLRTQANDASSLVGDHSDHVAAGHFASAAAVIHNLTQLEHPLPVKLYMGYPIRLQSPNISQADIDRKTTIFLDYARGDQRVCASGYCSSARTYTDYLSREYIFSNGLPVTP